MKNITKALAYLFVMSLLLAIGGYIYHKQETPAPVDNNTPAPVDNTTPSENTDITPVVQLDDDVVKAYLKLLLLDSPLPIEFIVNHISKYTGLDPLLVIDVVIVLFIA